MRTQSVLKNARHFLIPCLISAGLMTALFTSSSPAATEKTFHLAGTVHAYDKKSVTVLSGKTLWEIPRDRVKMAALNIGDPVEVKLKKEELKTLKHENVK
jgi:hypothetical protein